MAQYLGTSALLLALVLFGGPVSAMGQEAGLNKQQASPEVSPLALKRTGAYPWSPSAVPLRVDSAWLSDHIYVQHDVMKSEQARPWRRYALIGAVIGAASGAAYYYFAVESAPENRSIDSWVPSWVGYATFALPGALLGGLVGASIAYGGSNLP